MATNDPSAAIREITEAAREYCEGLRNNEHLGPFRPVSNHVLAGDGVIFVSCSFPFLAEAICAALNHAPAGWDARLEALKGVLIDKTWRDARAAVDRALALQRGEG